MCSDKESISLKTTKNRHKHKRKRITNKIKTSNITRKKEPQYPHIFHMQTLTKRIRIKQIR